MKFVDGMAVADSWFNDAWAAEAKRLTGPEDDGGSVVRVGAYVRMRQTLDSGKVDETAGAAWRRREGPLLA